MEKKDIKDYIHLYLGCDLDTSINGPYIHPYGCVKIDRLTENTIHDVLFALNKKERDQKGGWNDSDHIYCKPILRPLSSMTEEEAIELYDLLYPDVERKASYKYTIIKDQCTGKGVYWEGNVSIQDYVKWFPWLLSKGFDLFGLIESGLAIDSTLKPV